MIAADGVRALAIASLAAAILAGHTSLWAIVLAAFVEGTGSVFFGAAHPGALRAVVPPSQLPAAAGAKLGVNFARTWSCYKGGAIHCGTCGTCVERREAFLQAGVVDPTEYASRDPLPPKPIAE